MSVTVWPDGIQAALAVTIDVDAETLWFGRNPASRNSPCHLSEGAYGPRTGVPRLLQMLNRLAVKATFFVPGWVIENHREVIQSIVSEGHEIGYHGYLHEKAASLEEEAALIDRCMTLMDRELGVRPVGYRYPEFGLRPGIVDVLVSRGFEYSSNLMDRDHPYLHAAAGGRYLVELPTSWLFDDSSHFFLTIQEPQRRPIQLPRVVKEMWLAEWDGLRTEEGCMVLVLHPQFIGRVSRVRMLEELLAAVKGQPGALVAPGAVIARAARTRLVAQRQGGVPRSRAGCAEASREQ